MEGKKKNINKLQSVIKNDLRDLEKEADKLTSQGDDVDRIFELLRRKLDEKYRALKQIQREDKSKSDIFNDLNRLKIEAESSSSSKLRKVHKEINELKTTVLFAAPPLRINQQAILSAIDHIGVESDSEDTDEIIQPTSSTSPPESDDDSLPSTSYEIPPEVPFNSYSRHISQPRSRSSDSERPSRRSSDHGRNSVRGGQEDYDTKSFASQSSLSAPKQTDLLSPIDLLVGPGASQTKPSASLKAQSTDPHRGFSSNNREVSANGPTLRSPVRQIPSPIPPRSPSPKSHRTSTPTTPSHYVAEPSAAEISKPKYHYFNPETKTIELTDTSLTPERKPQTRQEDTKRSIEAPRTSHRETRGPLLQAYQEPPQPTYPEPHRQAYQDPPQREPYQGLSLRSSTVPLPPPGKGPAIKELCSNKKMKRYFTERNFTSSDHQFRGTIEELYNPSLFFVLPSKAQSKRDRVQIEVANFIHTNSRGPIKSHSIGKMVLCLFYDKQWYRACIVKTLPDYKYTVLFVDYGNCSDKIDYTNLREMPDFLQEIEPMCVQQCHLAGIMPPDLAEHWDPSTIEALWDLVSDKELKITVQDLQNGVYGVVLQLKEGHNEININEKLIEMGLAIRHHVESAEPMKELCTSPTRFNSPSAFHEPVSSPTSATKPPHRKSRNRTPPSTRPPGSFGNSGLMNQPKTSPISRNRNQSSSSDEEPLVGRPPSFESVRQPIAQPSNSGYSFGDTSAKGRGNVFGGMPHGGSFGSEPEAGYDHSRNEEPQPSDLDNRSRDTSDLDNRSRDTSDPDKWKRDRFVEVESELSPPNFKISFKDLTETSESIPLDKRAAIISPSTFVPGKQPSERKILKARSSLDKPPPSFVELDRERLTGKSESTDQSEGRSDGKTLSSSVDVISDGADSGNLSAENGPDLQPGTHEDMEGLEGKEGEEELGEATDVTDREEPPSAESESLTAKLREILYDPRSYSLGDLTEESVYKDYQKGEVTRLQTEGIPENARLLPVIVNHVESPDLFCVSPLNKKHIDVLNAMTASLTQLYSKKSQFTPGDKVSQNEGGNIREGVVLKVNLNLLQIRWEGSASELWVQSDLVEKIPSRLSKMISNKLAVNSCKIEFEKGEFCVALYTCPAGSVSWYRAIVLDTHRKGSTKKVYKYTVLFVDYGNVEVVNVQHVRPLPTKFSKLPAQSIPCSLPEVQALSPDEVKTITEDEDDEGTFESDSEDDSPITRCSYSREAREAFSNLILNERVYLNVQGDVVPMFYGYRKDVEVSDENALEQFYNTSLPVSIIDRVDDKPVNIADEFVKEGYAERILNLDCGVDPGDLDPTSSAALEDRMKNLQEKLDKLDMGRISPLNIPTPNSELSSDIDTTSELSSFDPMSEDFNSETNLADHDKDDVGVAVYGQKLERRTLCRFFSRGRTCYKGSKCRYLHQKKSDFHSLQSEQAMVTQTNNKPPSPTNDMPVIVQITSVLTPFHFWAQILPHDINPGAIEQGSCVADPLSDLTRKMNSLYRYKGYRETKYYPAIGEIVAVKSQAGNADNYRRSRVTETDEVGEGMCRVFHLDYGTFEIVHEKSLRVMDPDFIKELPFQAQEMLLADVRPAYPISSEPVYVGSERISNEREATAARNFFLERVTGKWMIAKVIERRPGGPLCVHLWDCSTDNYVSLNKELVKEGFAETVYQLPDELTTDCGTMASTSYQTAYSD
ncbi:hypothetical protein ACHWQZ_G010483 [Mnemiopsis leidyi]